ncbi:hypothetical protein M422DRAFT_153488 [Sphaerobolus stellatus SS14]|nr:hypothetical protein M422DRAFT_152665 [Sphaerobolus stellatus SS14]KIJ55070.1 hypothetical protein M422DRAFT_153488 [Sphaerobolus stellatus SS14]
MKPLPTGVRRNITLDKLVPLDAPTQPRTYVTDSATSRKAVPAAFKKKRGISEVAETPSGVPLEDAEAIEDKRRKNTLAARKSRARKLETLTTLQEAVNVLQGEKEYWMHRVGVLEGVLREHGLSVPP